MYAYIKSSLVHFKDLMILFVNYTFIKLENKVNVFSVVHELWESMAAEFTSQGCSQGCGDS